MTGVRLDRFLASTAIALLLCAGGAAWAGSSSGDQDAATETTSSVSDQPAAVSSDTATDPATEAAPAPPAEIDFGHSLAGENDRTRRRARCSDGTAGRAQSSRHRGYSASSCDPGGRKRRRRGAGARRQYFTRCHAE